MVGRTSKPQLRAVASMNKFHRDDMSFAYYLLRDGRTLVASNVALGQARSKRSTLPYYEELCDTNRVPVCCYRSTLAHIGRLSTGGFNETRREQ